GAPLVQTAQSMRVDEIIVAVEDKRGLAVWDLLECRLNGIEVIDYLNFWEREFAQIDVSNVGPGTLAFTGGFQFSRRRRVLKRAADFTVSLLFLAAVLPVTILVALAIKLESRGPIFYRQERVGLNGRIFRVWKFRSMRVDAEKDGVPRWACAKDNRVTRVGKFIRATRIDEIPQIINVLEGDMSFIGPRPERPYFVEQLRREMPYYDLRHRVKPGITGWAQVNYRYGESIEDARQKLAFDLYYVKNNDFFLDLTILVQTVRVVLFAHGAQ
ncbi:MAG: TIGR03013 family PEP-CTERM/XrtA system glycosyltransferase, partial [Alphaproteobacteria bacterium]|nr:TIGR03013 family PEP-CTERM/XrtA system glycosyltransferase [Alphaproteobacteria bacterium]